MSRQAAAEVAGRYLTVATKPIPRRALVGEKRHENGLSENLSRSHRAKLLVLICVRFLFARWVNCSGLGPSASGKAQRLVGSGGRAALI